MSRVASARWAAKDLILSILSRLGASGAVGHAIEFTQMLDRMATLVRTGNLAVIADAYTGCRGLLNVAHRVKRCEHAGTVIQIEDPEFPNKCGHTPFKHCVPVEEMVEKVRFAGEPRADKENFLITTLADALAPTAWTLQCAVSRPIRLIARAVFTDSWAGASPASATNSMMT